MKVCLCIIIYNSDGSFKMLTGIIIILLESHNIQECDIVAMASPVTKYSKLLVDPKWIKYELEKALFMCQFGRPGPILLDIPIDIQNIEINPDELIGFQHHGIRSAYDLEKVDQQIDQYLEDLYIEIFYFDLLILLFLYLKS